jgi:hypothetical protein
VTSNIIYGANKNYNGSLQNLSLDFYEPLGDTAAQRPLIIWAHGGSFVTGTKNDPDITTLCQRFTKKGFICASINYRIGTASYDSVSASKAVLRAIQDMKAAIRFFYKDKQTVNQFKVDTNNIFIGGSSAGAITALCVEFVNKSCEITPYVNQTDLDTLGGLEGKSGNQCYSRKVKGVINLCGGMVKYGWLEAGDIPFCSMHGTSDAIVPYNIGKLNPGIPIMYCDGSRMLYQQSLSVGVANPFYTWYGAGHMPYDGNTNPALAYMDTTVNFVRDYLISRLSCSDTPLQAPNTPWGASTLYPYTTCTLNNTSNNCVITGIDRINETAFSVELYPNPATGDIVLVMPHEPYGPYCISLTNLAGIKVHQEETNDRNFLLKRHCDNGLYILRITDSNGKSVNYKMVYN